ncbi:menaquinol oxidoreductase [Geoalkalibacter halelectricus]|uniref:Menaquinol oxidoreductase n=1 Tax=Geoalkalibacter halelectricus TaxID=2847045 RepID=A0ABY5ZNW6_9BACT|nr:menaquinol oxidoreductase [Geoalkalibacter halelectricus]MDO3377393.1 menaquinol oxidoreductase [Geoalkalibacter halelectricus]UWZ80847.1 menaquinol oxidoreductase [Geoalkalibacter halelectricus]
MRNRLKLRRPPPESQRPTASTDAQAEARVRIRRLQALSRRGLWGLAVFLLISLVAFTHDTLLPPISPGVRSFLGGSPPTNLISIALVVYSFSALVLILSRMSSGEGKYRGWSHIGYLSGFYAFYFYGEALDANFWAVFAAGFTIMSLEHYQMWSFCSESIANEKEALAKAERLEKFNS